MSARLMELSLEQQLELTEFYWHTDIATTELQTHFALPKGRVHEFVVPLPSGRTCPNCQDYLIFTSRAAQLQERHACPSCQHEENGAGQSGGCRCALCVQQMRDEHERREAARREQIRANHEEWLQGRCTAEYAAWALGQLDRRTRLVYQAMVVQVRSDEDWDWEAVCDRAGVVSHKSYFDKLLNIELVFRREDGTFTLNTKIDPEAIVAESVRKISNSLRFEVFQDDDHTCQYCGRRPPEVELQVDHLLPVARGGTDARENLVTSCRECNSGKSAKLIKSVTGLTRDERAEVLKGEHAEKLQERRVELERTVEHWTAVRGAMTSYDSEAIHRWIDRYNPAWIREAVEIAKERGPSNYVKYVGAILRRWGSEGHPDDVAENRGKRPDARPATEKQVSYVESLLEQAGKEISEYGYTLETLTRDQASDVISQLT